MLLAILGSCRSRSVRPFTVFTIAVIGDGVPGPVQSGRVYPLNRAQGRDMWSGAKAAFEKSPRLSGIRDLVVLEPYDDGGNASEAQRIAREIQSQPNVIAVIGHATSETTRAAAWLYNEVGIPLVMPIATSPNAVYPPNAKPIEENRLQNCVRLPPSDDRVQAPAIAVLVRNKLSPTPKRIALLRDMSKDTPDYSGPLYDRLDKFFPEIIKRQNVDVGTTNFQTVVAGIREETSDLIIFCGYGTTAVRLFQALRTEYASVSLESRPKIILTDGCRIPDLDTRGFDTYLTFPLPSINSLNVQENADFRILAETIQNDQRESYQLDSYDAMLMIGEVIGKCRHELSRLCVRQQLLKVQDFRGVVATYSFRSGENIVPTYYVYHQGSDEQTIASELKVLYEIQPNEIRNYIEPNP